jgi:hypothetical protein
MRIFSQECFTSGIAGTFSDLLILAIVISFLNFRYYQYIGPVELRGARRGICLELLSRFFFERPEILREVRTEIVLPSLRSTVRVSSVTVTDLAFGASISMTDILIPRLQ